CPPRGPRTLATVVERGEAPRGKRCTRKRSHGHGMTMALVKRESKQIEPAFERFDRMIDRLFGDWLASVRQPSLWTRWMPDGVIRVDEYQENGTLVVKAELPGIDPDKDVELTVSDGMLHIRAERRE